MVFSKETKILAGLYAVTTLWWLVMTIVTRHHASFAGNLFGPLANTTISFLGGAFGLIKAKRLEGVKTHIGRAIGATSLGLIVWSFGNAIWAVYLFVLNVDLPYPSIADAGFASACLFWIYGAWQLMRITGAQLWPPNIASRMFMIGIPLAVAGLSYYLVVELINGGIVVLSETLLKTVFDYYYVVADVFIVSLIIIVFRLSRRFYGSQHEMAIFILLLGHLALYISDFSFAYTTTLNTYFNGSLTDFLFSNAMFLIAVGILNLDQGLGSAAFDKEKGVSEFHQFVVRVSSSMQDLQLSLRQILEALAKQLKVGKISVFLLNEETLNFDALYSLTAEDKTLARKNPIVIALRIRPATILWDELLSVKNKGNYTFTTGSIK